MQNKKVIIRVDGNRIIGLGHLYRGIALAAILKNNFKIEFLLREGTIFGPIIKSKFKYQLIPEEVSTANEPDWISKKLSKNDIIVLDGYQFGEEYQKELKHDNFMLVYIDDLMKGMQHADVVINQSPGIKKDDYEYKNYTKLALGLNFALLRKSFIEFDNNKLQPKNTIQKIFISFGGADSNDFTYKTALNLLDIDFITDVNVIVGAAYEHRLIYDIKHPKLRIFKNQSEKSIFKIMLNADLAIVPASNISIELAKLGVPMILGYYVDNQLNFYKGFVDKNVVIPIGNFNEFKFANLEILINKVKNEKKMPLISKKLLELFKSYDPKNIINLFFFDEPKIREAVAIDVKFVFDLSNDFIVRKNSYHSDKINYSNHKKWFAEQLKDKNILFFIIEINKVPIGQIRISIKENGSVFGISISNGYRGKGIALKSINLAITKYFERYKMPIYAYIKKANNPSIKLFEKAGFKYDRDEKVNNIDSFIYKLNAKCE